MNVLSLESNMETVEVKSGDGDSIPTSGSLEEGDKFGDLHVLPRVGDQYQARIPSIVPATDLSQLTEKLMKSEVSAYLPESFSLGLPIPLFWAYCKLESCGGILKSVTNEESQAISDNERVEIKVEPLITLHGEGKKVEGLQNCPSAFDSYPLLKYELNQLRGMYLLPGSLGEPWNDIENDSFLLGLYIFGKNLNLVKRFVGSKNMGDILSFYYGKFYRSERYRRWSECRKLRTRRCIHGQKIFTGWRQQELLSRLFSSISEGCQNQLIELCRAFGEGKVPFEEYVFALRDAVGVDMLINAVSIGKGKQDLTGNAVEPMKTNQILLVRPEIPTGKACSSLTSAEIIKFLTGDFRLSKARSNDLFWEAVWPRLLAKGWHSEQPKDYAGFGSKQSLIFLIPGVKKFSRRRLVKGNHYFDSVSDVLNKVASEPALIKIEVPASEGSVDREEDRQDKQSQDGVLTKQQHCYLQPRTSNCNQNLMKFTIVDTSMVNGMEQRKVRELRSLLPETMGTPTSSSHSSESEQYTSEESDVEVEKINTSNPGEESSDKGMSIDSSDCTHIPEALNGAKVAVKNHKRHSDMLDDEHPRKSNKHQFIQKVKSGCSQDFSPIMKKHKLTTCNNEGFCQLAESTSIDRKLDLNEFASPSNEGNAIENQEVGEEVTAEKPETRMLIDLNLPHIELGSEIDRPLENNDDQCANTSSCSYEEIKFNEIDEFPDGHIELQPTNVNRRQSTRNRPLTTKALEALEYSFFNSKKKRKNVESSQHSSNSQSLRSSGRPTVSATFDNGAGNATTDTRAGEENLILAYSNGINLNSEAHNSF